MNEMASGSRTKLWIGFGIMALAAVIWTLGLRVTMGPIMSYDPSGSPGGRLPSDKLPSGFSMMMSIMLTYALSGVLFVGGAVVTAMGLIDYAAEVRRRG